MIEVFLAQPEPIKNHKKDCRNILKCVRLLSKILPFVFENEISRKIVTDFFVPTLSKNLQDFQVIFTWTISIRYSI